MLGQLGIIQNGAVVMRGETITAVGESQSFLKEYPAEPRIDASGCVVMPGLVDPHTHLPWVGDRANEFEMRLIGKSYIEIMTAGGGINSTVNTTRQASDTQLLEESRQRALSIFKHGTTTAEAKTGYGLTLESEMRLLQVLMMLNQEGPLELIPTFMGAHAIPLEYDGRPDDYVNLICTNMLPKLAKWWKTNHLEKPFPFVDVFCDQGAFTIAQSESIFKVASELGFPLKIHTDEFENLGGTRLAVSFGATSADHLVKTKPQDILALAASETVAVSLPCTPFGLAQQEYSPAREILAADGLFALASDLNPGTAWCGNMQFVIALACRTMKLTPAQAVAAATINAAAAIKKSGDIGSLEIGKQADLLVLAVDDYRQLAYRFGVNLVRHVIKKGRVYPN
ncbi:MAG: imidazolonepropionase [Anaerolineaceae bacterium]